MIKRINITIDDCLLNKIDSYSKKRYISRSSLISLVLSSYLDYEPLTDCDEELAKSSGKRRDPT